MPNYDFVCDKCDVKVTEHFSFKEEHKLHCTLCNELMRKVIFATPSHFRGAGWGGK